MIPWNSLQNLFVYLPFNDKIIPSCRQSYEFWVSYCIPCISFSTFPSMMATTYQNHHVNPISALLPMFRYGSFSLLLLLLLLLQILLLMPLSNCACCCSVGLFVKIINVPTERPTDQRTPINSTLTYTNPLKIQRYTYTNIQEREYGPIANVECWMFNGEWWTANGDKILAER